MSQFGFTVKRANPRIRIAGEVPDGWCVFLPHQCDAWDIAGETDGSHSDGDPHTEAVAALESFIAEAQQALDALKAEQEIGDGL